MRTGISHAAIPAALLLLLAACGDGTEQPGRAATTPAPRPTTAPTSEPTATPIPAPKVPWAVPADFPAGFLLYDPASYNVFTRNVAGTAVEVAVHEAMTEGRLIDDEPAMAQSTFAQLVFSIFERHVGVFGGFPLDRYVVVVRGPDDDPVGYFITSRWGLEIALGDAQLDSTVEREPPHGYTWPFARDWVAHEMFHAWNGPLITAAPTGSDLVYQAETWFAEGATVYYTARAYPDDAAFYREMLEDAFEEYEQSSAADRGLSFAEMAARTLPPSTPGAPPGWNRYVGLLYWKGVLVSYLLDLELRERGRSLDDLMRHLYLNYGLEDRFYTNADLLLAANEVAEADLSEFFEQYVTGGAPLPLSGDFQFLR